MHTRSSEDHAVDLYDADVVAFRAALNRLVVADGADHASKAGAPTNPSWYHNLLADPRAVVEVGDETFEVTVAVATGEERDRLFAAHAAQLPIYAEYQHQTSRQIPAVVLHRSLPV
jgi:deazaflavin-dependent oxidoreductase (nitroreductase family)